MLKPYLPSNGTEGMQFEEKFCDRCWHDRAGKKYGCPIRLKAGFGEVSEWVTDEKGPRCIRFEERSGHLSKPRENKAQGKLF